MISVSHLAKIVLIIHQRTSGSNCFHHSFAAISFLQVPHRLIMYSLFFFFSNDFVRNILQQKSLNLGTFEPLGFGKHSCAICVASFLPLKGHLFSQKSHKRIMGWRIREESPSITLCCIPHPLPIGRKAKFAN